MEKLKKDLKSGRKISDQSIKIYASNINKLAKAITEKEYSNNNFLKNFKVIIKYLEEKKPATRKNYLASILVALSPEARGKYKKGFEKVAKEYTDYLKGQAADYERGVMEQKKTQKENNEWATKKDLEKIRRQYGNAIKKLGYTQKSTELKKEKRHMELIQKYLVASLYLIHLPRRNVYANTEIIKNKDFNKLPDQERDSNNYLVINSRNSKFFSFGNYKSVKHHGVQKIKVERKLNSIINLWLNFNKSKHLLLNSQGGKLSTNGLTKFLHKVFSPLGKNISSSMIRKIILTEKYGDESSIKEKTETATKMGHSVEEQQKTYVKKS